MFSAGLRSQDLSGDSRTSRSGLLETSRRKTRRTQIR